LLQGCVLQSCRGQGQCSTGVCWRGGVAGVVLWVDPLGIEIARQRDRPGIEISGRSLIGIEISGRPGIEISGRSLIEGTPRYREGSPRYSRRPAEGSPQMFCIEICIAALSCTTGWSWLRDGGPNCQILGMTSLDPWRAVCGWWREDVSLALAGCRDCWSSCVLKTMCTLQLLGRDWRQQPLEWVLQQR
jgi:hypothetical protein